MIMIDLTWLLEKIRYFFPVFGRFFHFFEPKLTERVAENDKERGQSGASAMLAFELHGNFSFLI